MFWTRRSKGCAGGFRRVCVRRPRQGEVKRQPAGRKTPQRSLATPCGHSRKSESREPTIRPIGIQKTNEQTTGKVPFLPNISRGLGGGRAVPARRVPRLNEARRGTGRKTRGRREPWEAARSPRQKRNRRVNLTTSVRSLSPESPSSSVAVRAEDHEQVATRRVLPAETDVRGHQLRRRVVLDERAQEAAGRDGVGWRGAG